MTHNPPTTTTLATTPTPSSLGYSLASSSRRVAVSGYHVMKKYCFRTKLYIGTGKEAAVQ